MAGDASMLMVSATATVFVAVFAGVQLLREWRREGERRAAANARISAHAFVLRRQLQEWFGDEPASGDGLEDWIRKSQNDGTLERHLRLAEHRMVGLLRTSADASPAISANLREAMVLLFAGTKRLRTYVRGNRPSDGDAFFDWLRKRSDAVADLRECIKLLEAAPIELALLKAEGILGRRRTDEDPFRQLARAIVNSPSPQE